MSKPKISWKDRFLIAWGVVVGAGVLGVFVVGGVFASRLEWASAHIPPTAAEAAEVAVMCEQ